MKNLTKEAILNAPSATARYTSYLKKIGLPRSLSIVNSLGGGSKQAEEPKDIQKMEEVIYDHVMSKISEDLKPEEIMTIFSVVGAGIEKMAGEEVDSVNTEEFIEKIKNSIDDGSLFNLLEEKNE